MVPALVSPVFFFNGREFLALLGCEFGRNLLMRFGQGLSHAPRTFSANGLKLLCALFDKRCDFRRLRRREVELVA